MNFIPENRGIGMFGVLLRWIALAGQYYRYFVDSPIKQTMPIFTEWLIPEALGLHTEVWLQAAPTMQGAGFHHRYRLDLGVREKAEAQAQIYWELTRIELAWRVGKDFYIDPWQLERQEAVQRQPGLETWVQWNADDLKSIIDLEAPAYSARAMDFTLKANIFVKKIDPHMLQYTTTSSSNTF